MNTFFTLKSTWSKCVLFFLFSIYLFSHQLTAQEVIEEHSDHLSINLLEISSLSTRIQFYDFLRSSEAFGNAPLENGILHIETTKANTSEIAMMLREGLDEIVEAELKKDKELASKQMLELNEKYGYDLFDKISGRDDVNDMCSKSFPFCTSDIYTFPAGVNSGTAESGPYYGCLTTQPNPAWYHMRILVSGNINIYMESSPLEDIDYIVWGPFDDPVAPCSGQLTSAKVVSCSYSPDPTETAVIPNGQTGEYYILLITNFSNDPCEITFSKTGGTGETDCSILPPPISSNSPVCVGETLELYADNVVDATYHWTGPNGFTSNEQNPTINNVTLDHAGTYTLVITVGGEQSEPIDLEVIVNATPAPDFDFTEACPGEEVIFTDLSTVDPASSQITSWYWAFGDGSDSELQNPTHTYTAPGTYQVTLTTYTGEFNCARDITKSVALKSAAVVNAGADQNITTGWTTQLNGTAEGGSGDFLIDWQPSNMLEENDILDPTTLPIETTTIFTLNVTDNQSGCLSSDQVTIFTAGGALGAILNANPETICFGEMSLLTASPFGGSGNYSFLWTTVPPSSWQGNTQEVYVAPAETTTYQVEVNDGQNSIFEQITVTVGEVNPAYAGPDITIPAGTTTTLLGETSGSDNYEVWWEPDSLLVSANLLQPETLPLEQTTEYTLTITNALSGCQSIDLMTVFVSGSVMVVNPGVSLSEICPGDTAQLFANVSGGSGEYTYQWSSDPVGFSSDESNPLVSPEQTTIYTLVVDDGNTQMEASVTVNVGSLSEADAGADVTIDFGWTANLSGNVTGDQNYSFEWSPAEFLDNPESLTPTTVPLEQNKQFTLLVTNNTSGCETEDQVQVIVTGGPLGVEISSSENVICSGTQVQLNAIPSGGSGIYTYQWSSSGDGFTSDIPNPVIEPVVSTTYTVTINDGMNTATDQVTITVNPSPVAHAGNNQVINVGTFTTLYGSATEGTGNYSYQWSPAASLADPVNGQYQLQPQTALLYETVVFNLDVTDQNGCADNSTTTVIVGGDQLGVFVEASETTICYGENTQLHTTPFGGGSENYTYTWTVNNDSWTSSIANPVVAPGSTSIYQVEVSDGFTTASAEITITVNPLPEVDIVPAGYDETDNTIFVCVRDSVWLDAGPGMLYYWMNGAVTQKQKALTNGNWIDVQHWSVRVTDPQTGCLKRDSLIVFFDFNTCNIGLDEWDSEKFMKIYPNPSKGSFNVIFNNLEAQLSLKVINPTGQLLFKESLEVYLNSGNTHQIDLFNYPTGVYYLIITDGKDKIVRKLIRM